MTSPARYHVLLIGIDDYRVRSLSGCVNDIDAVQELLLGPRMGLPSDSIRRLASPRPERARLPGQAPADPGGRAAEQPATLANVRDALASLASERVAPSDRVFIYYAGHGARLTLQHSSARLYHREALVMTDHDPARPDSGMLFDYELNRALRKIAERTSSVALVLDCCHAAGATRSSGELRSPEAVALAEPAARCLDSDPVVKVPDPDPASLDTLDASSRMSAAVSDCQVVAACLGHERANEESEPGGARHGLLTRAFLAALAEVPDPTLHDLTWGRIWQRLSAAVSQRNPVQHPRMAGSAGRAVFAGPPVDRDPGIPVSGAGPRFQIAAGTLANITEDAVLAIYGDRPPYFPPVGSAEDRRTRVGLVRVDRAELATATAVTEGPAFELPPDARGRMIATGKAFRLRCTVIPSHLGVESQLRTSPLLEVVSPDASPDVRLEHSRGRWFLTDGMYSTQPDRPILFSLRPEELDRARRVMEHYRLYSLPVRMAARMADLRGQLDLRVRIHRENRATPANIVQSENSQQIAATVFDTCVLRVRAQVCFEVRNHSSQRLRVTLVNSAASGRVQFLGDEIIDAGSLHVFFANATLDQPFEMMLPPGLDHGLDRLIAIGRTAYDHDLDYLRVDRTFAEVAHGATRVMRSGPTVTDGGGRPVDDGVRDEPAAPPPIEQWTTDQVIIETRRW
jgi:hypothetical protein